MPDETDNKSDIKSDKHTNSNTTKKSQAPVPLLDHISNKKSKPEKINENKSKNHTEKFELPTIPDYDRPDLEKYEKSDFTPSDFSKRQEIPAKGVFKLDVEKESRLKSLDNNTPPSSEPKAILNHDASDSRKKIKKTPEENCETDLLKSFNVSKPEVKKPPDDVKSQNQIEKNENLTSSSRWKKYEDLAEIESFFTPDLEVYEKSDFNRGHSKYDIEKNLDHENALKNTTKEKELIPIEILITEPEETTKKSVSFDPNTKCSSEDDLKKKKPRRVYDPLAWIPDDEIVEETQAQIDLDILTPLPELPKKSKPKYDPFAYIPDKDDVPSEIIMNEDQVNKRFTNNCKISKFYLNKHRQAQK